MRHPAVPAKLAVTIWTVVVILGAAPCLAQIPAEEREALIALYDASGGEEWTESAGWLGPVGGECGWARIQCDGGHVYRIALSTNNLKGTLPPQIGNFPRLSSLDLSGNALTGEIPEEIENLESLRSLNLMFNELSGEIPGTIGALDRLEQLFLSSNELSGSIPDSISMLGDLRRFEAWGNHLNGTIPAAINDLRNLETLDLAGNDLSGELPSGFNTMVSLRALYLGRNELTGTIPAALGSLPIIETIDLQRNALTGSIPEELGLSTTLRVLNLEENQLTGPIPSFAGAMSLETILLGENSLTSVIPPSLVSLPAIRRIDLSGNDLEGAIPVETGDSPTLERLDLSGNQLTGGIPASLGNLSSLEDLHLELNPLGGEIPAELGALVSLRLLHLDRARLTGAIPRTLGNLVSLEELHLGTRNSWNSENNQLTGTIPRELGALTELRELNLGWNRLTGEIPRELGSLDRLEELVVSGNELSGDIPIELGNLSSLQYLLLRSNRLEGPIPTALTTLQNLRWMHLFQNRLSGQIPEAIGDLGNLTQLLLDRNRLEGPLPASISKLRNLTWLDVSDNRLSGPLPENIGDMERLATITLTRSGLGGDIPASFWSMSSLETAYLGGNDFSGTIPPNVSNLVNLRRLSLWENRIRGSIPPEIGALPRITDLDLASNRLGGPIPVEIGQAVTLSSLDLSRNALSGVVPSSLGDLPLLGSIDLRYNALSTRDRELRSMLDAIQVGDWDSTQTVTPAKINAGGVHRQRPVGRQGGGLSITDRSVDVSWQPIEYRSHDGGYEVRVDPLGGGVPIVTTTASKRQSKITVRGLQPDSDYVVSVRATTHPHGTQQNFIRSEPSRRITVRTTERRPRPAEVALVSAATGLIQIDGNPQNTGQYVLGNFGDVETTITLAFDPDFFTETPHSFVLGPGETQLVTLESIPGQPPGTRWGNSYPRGEGVPDGLVIPVALLSTEKPEGIVAAEAVRARVDLSGSPGTTTVGQATFRNVGTSSLEGVLLSDVEWIETTPDRIVRISAGSSVTESFTVVREKRPLFLGALSGSLRLLYVNGSAGKAALDARQTGGTSISTSLVTVVDTATPAAVPAQIPLLQPGEVRYLVPGVRSGDDPPVLSDLVISSVLEESPGVELYRSGIGSGESSVVTIESLGAGQYFTAGDVLRSVFDVEGGIGTIHVRTPGSDAPDVESRLIVLGAEGRQFLSFAPAFSTTSALPPGERLEIVGVPRAGVDDSSVVVQEVSGRPVTMNVRLYDAGGTLLGEKVSAMDLAGFELARLDDDFPEGTARIVIESLESSSGTLMAWVEVREQGSDDLITLVDWRRLYNLPDSAPMMVPITATDEGETTELVLGNPASERVEGTLVFFGSGGERREESFELEPGEVLTIDDLAGRFGSDGAGHLVIEPVSPDDENDGSGIVGASRIVRTDGGIMSSSVIPLLSRDSGLRLGQRRRFAGLDSLAEETEHRVSAGFRTGFGITETAGADVVVRATLQFSIRGSIAKASSQASIDLDVPAHGTLVFDDAVREIAGTQAAAQLGNLFNLEIDLKVVDGEGAAAVFVRTRDVGSGDVEYRF